MANMITMVNGHHGHHGHHQHYHHHRHHHQDQYSVASTLCLGEAALVVALEISWLLDLASSTSRILVNIDIGDIGDIDNIGPFNLENIDS